MTGTTLMYKATVSADSLTLSGGEPPPTTTFERVDGARCFRYRPDRAASIMVLHVKRERQ